MSKSCALITGGNRGLGAHLVRGFAKAGYEVVFTFLHNHDEAHELVAEVCAHGGHARAMQMDVRDREAVSRTVAEIKEKGGDVAVLINNAGVSRDGMSWKLGSTAWQETLDTNLTGTFQVTQSVLPGMRQRGGGRILNIASVVGQRGIAGTAAYAASKAALGGFTRAVAKEVAARGITINDLVLGYFDAGMGALLPEAARQSTLASIPAGVFGDPEKLARIAIFLCSDACDYITGQQIVVDGGFLSS